MERLLQRLRGLLRLTAVTLQALLRFQATTLAGFGVFLAPRVLVIMVYSCILCGSWAVAVSQASVVRAPSRL